MKRALVLLCVLLPALSFSLTDVLPKELSPVPPASPGERPRELATLGTLSGPVLVVYFDEALTQRTICLASPGDTITAYIVAENFMRPIVSLEYRVSYGACTFVSEEVVGGLGTGTASAGIKIDFFSPGDASNQLLVERIRLRATCSTGCNASGAGQAVTPYNYSTTVPLRAYDVDGWPISAIGNPGFACSNGAPDLDIVSFSAPASAMLYQNIASLLSLTVANAGTDTTSSSVIVEYRLSTDTIFTSADLRLAYRTLSGVWPHGTNKTAPVTTATIPLNAPTGNLYIGAIVDPMSTQGTSSVRELDETNNISYRPITIVPDPSIDTSYVYAEDFQDGDGGWAAKDATVAANHWHQATSLGVGFMYCGSESLFPTPGYGHNWNESIDKTYTMTSSVMTLDYSIQWDLEADFDFVRVQYSLNGGAFSTLEELTATSMGFEQHQKQVIGASGDLVTIRFQVNSDGGYDDEDGSYDSDGACRLDWVQFAGDRDDFDAGDDGWLPTVSPGAGGAFRLVYDPIYYPSVPGQDNNTTGAPQRACNVWVPYDPVTEQFPFASPADSALGRGVDIAIESPAIAIDTAALAYQLEFDVYGALPLNGGVFYYWAISFPPYASWEDGGTVYYGLNGWITVKRDVTTYVPAGATEMKIRLGGKQDFTLGSNTGPHTPSPSFDNVKLMLLRTTMPGLDVSGFPRDCQPADEDRDGVGDLTDACPTEGSSFFDRDGDGCIGEAAGARHVEYLQNDTLRYYVNAGGAPGIGDGSDIIAVQQGVDAWSGLPGSTMRTQFLGTTAQSDGNALDGVNIVTFSDPDYVFPTGVLGVGITTSFEAPDRYLGGRPVLPGRVFDCDILFNPLVQFRTPTAGSGVDLRSVSTHEAGHLFGLSHSAVRTSTMFYVLPPDTQAASLEIDDRLIMFKAYPDAAALAAASRLTGTVTDGKTSVPVPGAIVFALDAASGDTLGSDYTLPDGSFEFVGLPDGSYYVSIYPLNGSSLIGYLQPGNINSLVNENAVTVFVPEYYDASESADDDPSARAAIAVSAGSTVAIAIVTNIDDEGPVITAVNPPDGRTGVKIDASILVSFSEPIDITSVSGDFRLVDTTTLQFVSGNAALVHDDSTLTFIPSGNLDFETVYRLEIGAGIQDKFGNPLGAAYQLTFTTELQPDVAITSLAPRKSVEGALVVVSGFGFEESPTDNMVSFNGAQATVLESSSTRLLVTVPPGATTGNVTVTNVIQGKTSNAIQFTVLAGDEVARGFESGAVALPSVPRALSIAPDGAVAFVATETGYTAVVVDPGDPGYLSAASFPIAGGLDEIDVAPDGKRAYAVSRTNGTLYRINAERGAGGLADLVVLNEMPSSGEPLGVLVEPAGKRAFVPTAAGEIQIWDVSPPSATFDSQIGAISLPGKSLRGKMATDPAGKLLLVPTGASALLVYDIPGDSLRAEIGVASDPRDVAVDPMGARAYVTDGSGNLTIVSLEMLAKVIDVRTGGSLRSASITPAGSFLYAANRELNIYDVIDLRPESETYRSVAANIALHVNPIDAELAPDGLYAYSLSESDRTLVATGIGIGPVLRSMHPIAARPGATIVLAGSDLAADESVVVSFGQIEVAPVARRDSFIVVAVPPGAVSGPVSVIGRNPYKPDAPSNELRFTVLGASTSDALRLAAKLGTGGVPIGSSAAVSPAGKGLAYALDGGGNPKLRALDIDPASPTLHQVTGETGPLPLLAVDETEITPDGRRALVLDRGAGAAGEASAILIVDMVPLSETFMAAVDSIDVSALVEGASALCVSPTGTACAVAERGNAGNSIPASVHLYNIDTFGGNSGSPVGGADVAPGDINALQYHPAGFYCYLAMTDGADGAIRVLDADPSSGSFLSVLASVPLAGANPTSLSFAPDGRRCLVLATDNGTGQRSVVMLDTSDPASPATSVTAPFAAGGGGGGGRIEVSPAGDRAILSYDGGGIKHLRIAVDPDGVVLVDEEAAGASFAAAGYLPDAARWYGSVPAEDSLYVYDFSAASTLVLVSGNAQSGIVGQPLQAPLRVRVTGSGGTGVAGVPVTFAIASGEGLFPGTGAAVQVAATDASGAASASWTLGPAAGAQTVAVSSTGLAGSPLSFTATALADPATLPLQLVDVTPLDSTIEVSVTTAVLATFSRALDPASVDTAAFYLLESGATKPVAALIGMTDENRRLSITPRTALKANTVYSVAATAGLLDASGGPLQNPGSTLFRTGPPAELLLAAANPPSSLRGLPVVLSGSGFDAGASNNMVFFNDVPAAVTEASCDHLDVIVPPSLMQGSVLIEAAVGALTSNQLPFRILAAETTAIDKEVIANVGTGSSTKSVAVTPDGARLYAVSPMTNVVVCVDIWSFSALPAIPVGQNPHTIKINPAGTTAYVTNFLDNTVSVIDIGAGSAEFNQVTETIRVGNGPRDMILTPDGDRLVVSNSGSSDLSVVDTDEMSSTFNEVLATVTTGTSTKSIAVTPDGGLIYIATNNGYIVVDLVDYGVVKSVETGTSTKSVAVTPDGAYLILLTSAGSVLIYDISPGSATMDQVVGTVTTGSTTKSVAVTPDGGMLYLIQELLDAIIAFRLNHVSSSGALQSPDRVGRYLVYAEPVDTMYAGEDPAEMCFAPDGSGIAVITNAGDNTVSVYNPFAEPIAVALSAFDVRPIDRGAAITWKTLNEENVTAFVLSRRAGEGPFEPVTGPPIPARGAPAAYSITDEGVRPNVTYLYRLEAVDRAGERSELASLEFTPRARFALEQNVPNPFNPSTRIRFSVAEAGRVRLAIYDVLGRRVRSLVDRQLAADYYEVLWDGRNNGGLTVASGVYFCRLEAGKFRATKKMVLLR